MKKVLYVGMDVHKKTIAIEIAESGTGETRRYGTIRNEISEVNKMVRRLASEGKKLHFVYEAGPCGFGLCRHLKSKGHHCMVAAPSLIPRKPGDRIKTDRRDARNLAKLLRAGELTAVHVPDQEDEAMRDLVRCREDAVENAKRSKQRLKAFLLRHGRTYHRHVRWNDPYINWLAAIKMESTLLQITLQEYIDTAKQCQGRVDRITKVMEKEAALWKRAPMVKAYQGFRGVSFRVAVTVAAEIGDMSRFQKPAQLSAYLGLVPSEYSSGDSVRRGGITKTGNKHVRKALIEAAWTYNRDPRVSKLLLKRQEGLPDEIKELSWKAQIRINSRHREMRRRRKSGQKTVTAGARELCCFLWAADRALARA